MLRNMILQITAFPGAEAVHSLQGVVIGFLLARAYLEESLAQALVALTLLAGFCVYESLEQLRIADRGDIDVMVLLVTTWLSAVITLVVTLVYRWRKKI